MPAIIQNKSPNGLSIGLWEITESYSEILKMAGLSPEEKATLHTFKNENRRLQWLAVRVLLGEFMNPRPIIAYMENGKPYIPESDVHISISHSGNMAAIALHPTNSPGIDVELIHPKINKIATRFVNDEGMSFLTQDTLTEQLCIVWAAKEVLYKVYTEGMLSFKENITIAGFHLADQVELLGTMHKGELNKSYKLLSRKIKNYVLVHTID
jgi:4'-phosphopantetheinyl transferase